MIATCSDYNTDPMIHYQNSGLFLVFLSSSKTLPLVITHENLTGRHLVGKIYTKF
jgi:hypothetical protein